MSFNDIIEGSRKYPGNYVHLKQLNFEMFAVICKEHAILLPLNFWIQLFTSHKYEQSTHLDEKRRQCLCAYMRVWHYWIWINFVYAWCSSASFSIFSATKYTHIWCASFTRTVSEYDVVLTFHTIFQEEDEIKHFANSWTTFHTPFNFVLSHLWFTDIKCWGLRLRENVAKGKKFNFHSTIKEKIAWNYRESR